MGERRDLRGRPDRAIFEMAQAESWVVATENAVDYRPLAAAAMRAGRAYLGSSSRATALSASQPADGWTTWGSTGRVSHASR